MKNIRIASAKIPVQRSVQLVAILQALILRQVVALYENATDDVNIANKNAVSHFAT